MVPRGIGIKPNLRLERVQGVETLLRSQKPGEFNPQLSPIKVARVCKRMDFQQ